MFGAKSKEIARLKSELHKISLEDWREATQRLKLEADLVVANKEKQGWIDDYQRLNDRYTLLDSLLKQLHINITLPVKKNAGRG